MRRFGLAVVAFTLGLWVAATASAAVVHLTFQGDYNDSEVQSGWMFELAYNPSRAEQIVYEDGAFLTATPTAVNLARLTTYPIGVGAPSVYDLSDFDYLQISRSLNVFVLDFFWHGIDTMIGLQFAGAIDGPNPDFRLDRGTASFGSSLGYYGQAGHPAFAGSPHTHGIEMATTVPEPAGWALMLAGFGLAGSAVRHARRRSWASCCSA